KTEELKQQVRRSKTRAVLLNDTVMAGEQAPAEKRPVMKPAPAAPAPMSTTEMEVDLVSQRTSTWSGSSAPPPVTVAVGLAPPSGWQPPSYAPNLPVSLAGGYDLAFPSLRPETIKSGGGARRVALFSEAWPVAAERRVFPALATEAFLVAEIK